MSEILAHTIQWDEWLWCFHGSRRRRWDDPFSHPTRDRCLLCFSLYSSGYRGALPILSISPATSLGAFIVHHVLDHAEGHLKISMNFSAPCTLFFSFCTLCLTHVSFKFIAVTLSAYPLNWDALLLGGCCLLTLYRMMIPVQVS